MIKKKSCSSENDFPNCSFIWCCKLGPFNIINWIDYLWSRLFSVNLRGSTLHFGWIFILFKLFTCSLECSVQPVFEIQRERIFFSTIFEFVFEHSQRCRLNVCIMYEAGTVQCQWRAEFQFFKKLWLSPLKKKTNEVAMNKKLVENLVWSMVTSFQCSKKWIINRSIFCVYFMSLKLFNL